MPQFFNLPTPNLELAFLFVYFFEFVNFLESAKIRSAKNNIALKMKSHAGVSYCIGWRI